jgi:hypothetical protein
MIQRSGKPVFCVLDGLDECGNVSIDHLVTSVQELFSQSALTNFRQPASRNSYLKMAITSRLPHILLDKNSQQGQSVTESDVGIFIEAKFNEYFPLNSLSQHFDNVFRTEFHFLGQICRAFGGKSGMV